VTALARGFPPGPYADEVGAAAFSVSRDSWSPYAAAYDLDGGIEPTRTYLIATTQRSGSHLLAHAMARAGAAVPLEYANPFLAEVELMRRGRDITAYARRALLEEIRVRRTTPDGLFGLKAHWHHWEAVLSDVEAHRLLEPQRVIHVQRRDLLRQAVSLVFSRRTGSWISFHEGRGKDPGPFDASAIDEALGLIIHEQRAWEVWFISTGITPLRLCFDHIAADPQRTALAAARYVDEHRAAMPSPNAPVALPQRQDDAIKREWLARARVEFGFPRGPTPRADCCG
jgi:LPS sulfotransferase NodH